MTLGFFARTFDTVMALRDVARRVTGDPPAARGGVLSPPGLGQIETRLANVVVSALKEAFDRDHRRLELERAHLEEQRRRADEALRAEVRRQAVDREFARLRMLATTAVVGWVASMVVRLPAASAASRAASGVGWLLLLGALATTFTALRTVSDTASLAEPKADSGLAGRAALWLLTFGLGATAIAVLL